MTLPHGDVIHIRPLRVTDERLLQDLFYRLSDDSTYERFLAHKSCHPREEISMLADFDDRQNAAPGGDQQPGRRRAAGDGTL